jgi:GTP pyrophosphokinase
VDFAFALHSEIGLHASAAKVNGRMVPLDTKLKNGQWVDITTNPRKNPNPEWLNSVKTAKARSLIRRWIKQQRYEESKALGQDMMVKIEKQIGKPLDAGDHERLVKKYQVRSWNKFLAAVGTGDISPQSIYAFFGVTARKKKDPLESISAPKPSVSIQGMENLLVSFAKCCKPLPGDDIVGFVTRGRGMIIHRSDCENIQNLADDNRLIPMNWEPKHDILFVASIRVEAGERKDILSDIIAAISKCNCDIRTAHITTRDSMVIDDFDVNVKSLSDLQRLMREIRKVRGVSRVERLDSRTPENLDRGDAEH